jgi:isoquinoline 1-oxidoreductase subunit beta
MTEIVNVSRRDFLRMGLLAGGGLVLGLHLPSLATGEEMDEKGGTFALNAFVRVGTDDSVTVIVNHTEMGQGPYTSVPMLVAEELDADWAKVRFEPARAGGPVEGPQK